MLIDFFYFGRLFCRVYEKLSSLLSQLDQLSFDFVCLFRAIICEGSSSVGNFGRVVSGLGSLPVVLSFEQLPVESCEPFNHRVLVWIE